jgi:Mg2+-importing ATPase
MGDGINDALSMRVADVGISVDTAVDVAKESADIILLERSLMVLGDGIIEGRKVFANIIKYIRMGASSNFGNMLSMTGSSYFLKFLPMAPIQVLVNNLLYDLSQTGITSDHVDDEYLQKPRKWNLANVQRFMICIGPISSIFDYTTFALMLFFFGCADLGLAAPHALAGRFLGGEGVPPDATYAAALFHTGWFIESLITQTLIVHIIRTRKIPFPKLRKPGASGHYAGGDRGWLYITIYSKHFSLHGIRAASCVILVFHHGNNTVLCCFDSHRERLVRKKIRYRLENFLE